MAQKVLYFVLLLGAVLCGISIVLFFQHQDLYAQTQYFPPSLSSGKLIPVEIQIYDDPELGGVTIQDVSFDGQQIPLKPTGVYGFRGGGSFKKASGSYDLVWTIQRPGNDWPRTVQKKQKVIIKGNDVWVQISIHGENMTVL